MATSIDELFEFLDIAVNKGFINDNTAISYKTACKNFCSILEDGQKSVEYLQDNMDVIKARFTNLRKDVTGSTVDHYARRAIRAMNDFTAWKEDRSAWERQISAKTTARGSGEGEKKPSRSSKAEKPTPANDSTHAAGVGASSNSSSNARVVRLPLRDDFEVTITLPKDFTYEELQHLGQFLYPYVKDRKPNGSSRASSFPALEE